MEENKETKTTTPKKQPAKKKNTTTKKPATAKKGQSKTTTKKASAQQNNKVAKPEVKAENKDNASTKTVAPNKKTNNSKKTNGQTNQNRKRTPQTNRRRRPSTQNNKKVELEKKETKVTEPKKEILIESTTISELDKKENLEKTLIFEGTKEEKKQVNLEKTIIFNGAEKKNIAAVVKKLEEENIVVENKVIKRSKVKKVLIIIITIIMLALVVGTIYYVVDNQKVVKENSLTISSDIHKKATRNYKSVSDINKKAEAKNKIEDIDYSNIQTLTLGEFEEKAYNKEDMTVIVSSATCYSCISFEPVLNETLQELEKTVYRINITNLTTNEKDRFRTYYAFKATPTMFKVKDGKVIADYKGVMSTEELIDWLNK